MINNWKSKLQCYFILNVYWNIIIPTTNYTAWTKNMLQLAVVSLSSKKFTTFPEIMLTVPSLEDLKQLMVNIFVQCLYDLVCSSLVPYIPSCPEMY